VDENMGEEIFPPKKSEGSSAAAAAAYYWPHIFSYENLTLYP